MPIEGGFAALGILETSAAWASIAGVAVSILGFWVAIDQLRKTRTAAEAAQAALSTSQKSFASNQFLALVPELQALEGDIDSAVQANDGTRVLSLLIAWRRKAAEVQPLLGLPPDDDLSRSLAEAILQAARAKQALMSGRVTALEASKRARQVIADVNNRLAAHLSKVKTFSTPSGGV